VQHNGALFLLSGSLFRRHVLQLVIVRRVLMFFVTSFKFVSSFEGITHSPGMKQQTRLIVQNEIATGVFLQETSLEKVALLLIYALVLVVTVLYTIDIAFQLVILMSVFGVE
jgi:hypothetical protein